MYPYIQHQLTDARLADIHSQAERHQIARAARRAGSATQRPAAQPVTGPGSVLDHVLPALSHHLRPAGNPARSPRGRRTACVPEGQATVELIPHQVKETAVNPHNPPAPAVWAPRGRILTDPRPDQGSTPAATLRLPSDRFLTDACASHPDHPGDAARAAGRARLLPPPWLAGRRSVTGVALAAAGYAATWAAVTASGPLSRGAAVQVLFAAVMIVCALSETLLSPAVPPVTGARARHDAAGRRNRLGTCALAVGCLLGPSAGGAAAGAGWGASLLTTLAVACAVAGIAAQRHAGRHPAPAVSR